MEAIESLKQQLQQREEDVTRLQELHSRALADGIRQRDLALAKMQIYQCADHLRSPSVLEPVHPSIPDEQPESVCLQHRGLEPQVRRHIGLSTVIVAQAQQIQQLRSQLGNLHAQETAPPLGCPNKPLKNPARTLKSGAQASACPHDCYV